MQYYYKNKAAHLVLLMSMLLASGCDKSDKEEPSKIEDITVATVNVDGLPVSVHIGYIAQLVKGIVPPEFIDVETESLLVNPDGPGTEGSLQIGQKICEKDWDVFGLNEDFNYHQEIWKALDGYSNGTYQGRFEADDLFSLIPKLFNQETLFNIDGLGFGVRKKYSIVKEIVRPWAAGALYGYLTNDQDQLTTKGFRYYQVRFDKQTMVDFITLHADAGSDNEDIQARQVAMGQLYDFITTEIATDNPLVIMGDFNCYYMRDSLKELFIDRLNANPGFEAGDAWIECTKGGVYPAHADAAVPLDEQLDKIVYVNRKDAQLRLKPASAAKVTDFTDANGGQLSDHYPLQATFQIERN